MHNLNRRDFLRLVGLLPLEIALHKLTSHHRRQSTSKPNIIILVLDSLTSKNMSLYGYYRDNTPNMRRLADRALVYHSHYSAGTFTTAGTASLLTGMYPWSHRATNFSGLVRRDLAARNIYHLIGEVYERAGFTQNMVAELLLSQFGEDIDLHLPLNSYSVVENWAADVYESDVSIKYRAFDYYLYNILNGTSPGSLVFGAANRYMVDYYTDPLFEKARSNELQHDDKKLFFHIEDVFEGMASQLIKMGSPFFAYFHIYPPHHPYIPGPQFLELFRDSMSPKPKPKHTLLEKRIPERDLRQARLSYDQFIAHADSAFGRFTDMLESAGVLDNSYLILTSDHGEMFERGAKGHVSPLVYDSAIRVPLVISTPRRFSRTDIYSVTNSIDILPTVLQLAGIEIPNWCEGKPLPELGGTEDHERTTFSVDAKFSPAHGNLSTVSVSMRQGKYKLIYYKGHTNYKAYPEDKRYFDGHFELYDVDSDPEELNDLIKLEPALASRLQRELLVAYQKSSQSID